MWTFFVLFISALFQFHLHGVPPCFFLFFARPIMFNFWVSVFSKYHSAHTFDHWHWNGKYQSSPLQRIAILPLNALRFLPLYSWCFKICRTYLCLSLIHLSCLPLGGLFLPPHYFIFLYLKYYFPFSLPPAAGAPISEWRSIWFDFCMLCLHHIFSLSFWCLRSEQFP